MLAHPPVCVFSLLRNSVADFISDQIPATAPIFILFLTNTKLLRKVKKTWWNQHGKLWHSISDACMSLEKLYIYFTSILKLHSSSQFVSLTSPSSSVLEFGCLAHAHQLCAHNIHFMQIIRESSFKWVPSISLRICPHQTFPIGAHTDQRGKRIRCGFSITFLLKFPVATLALWQNYFFRSLMINLGLS